MVMLDYIKNYLILIKFTAGFFEKVSEELSEISPISFKKNYNTPYREHLTTLAELFQKILLLNPLRRYIHSPLQKSCVNLLIT